MAVTVRVPATSANLGAGFDTLGVALARHLVVTARERDDDATPRVTTVGHGEGSLSTGDDNLVWTSLLRFCSAYEVDTPDVVLAVDNRVPPARGLGSSSSAIVAGLVLGRELTGVAVGGHDLAELATDLEGHPDNVAPALLGGFVAAAVTGQRLVLRHAQPSPALAAVVAVPPVEHATQAARTVMAAQLGRDDVVDQLGRTSHVVGAMLGAWPLDAGLAGDAWHEPPRLREMPVSAAILDAWRRAGLFGYLSGAGPTAAALVPARPADVARAMQVARDAALAADEPDVEVARIGWDLGGATVLPGP